MAAYAGVSVRSLLAAGVAAATVGVVAISPVTPPASVTARIASPAFQLSAAVANLVADPVAADPQASATATATPTGAGDPIINIYTAVQPWIAYGWELVDWGMSLVPGLWWIAPGVDLIYFTAQPVVESLVFSFAYLLNGQLDLIGTTIQNGIQTAANNFVQYAINWVYSIVPFPPLPPFPIFPSAASSVKAAGARIAPARTAAAAAVAAPEAPAAQPVVAETITVAPVDEAPTAETPAVEAPVTDAPVTTEAASTEAAPTEAAPAPRHAPRGARVAGKPRAAAAVSVAGSAAGASTDTASSAAPGPQARKAAVARSAHADN